MAHLRKASNRIRGQPADVRRSIRQARSRPLVTALRVVLDDSLGKLAPKSPTTKAIRYGNKRWETFIFGAIFPQEGKAASLVLPFCNTDTMNLHLAEISMNVAPGAHAVLNGPGRLAPDAEAQAARQHLDRCDPLKESKAQPAGERLPVYARQLALKPVFGSYDEIVDHCCDAWNKLVEQPWRNMSLGICELAQEF